MDKDTTWRFNSNTPPTPEQLQTSRSCSALEATTQSWTLFGHKFHREQLAGVVMEDSNHGWARNAMKDQETQTLTPTPAEPTADGSAAETASSTQLKFATMEL